MRVRKCLRYGEFQLKGAVFCMANGRADSRDIILFVVFFPRCLMYCCTTFGRLLSFVSSCCRLSLSSLTCGRAWWSSSADHQKQPEVMKKDKDNVTPFQASVYKAIRYAINRKPYLVYDSLSYRDALCSILAHARFRLPISPATTST